VRKKGSHLPLEIQIVVLPAGPHRAPIYISLQGSRSAAPPPRRARDLDLTRLPASAFREGAAASRSRTSPRVPSLPPLQKGGGGKHIAMVRTPMLRFLLHRFRFPLASDSSVRSLSPFLASDDDLLSLDRRPGSLRISSSWVGLSWAGPCSRPIAGPSSVSALSSCLVNKARDYIDSTTPGEPLTDIVKPWLVIYADCNLLVIKIICNCFGLLWYLAICLAGRPTMSIPKTNFKSCCPWCPLLPPGF
jgi:hypothetical protein